MSELDINKLMDITDLPGIAGEEVTAYEPLVLKEVESNPVLS